MRIRNSRLYRQLRRFAGCREGASALEFALVLPPLCFLLVGMFEVGALMFTQSTMEGGLREAARFGMTGQLLSDPEARKEQILALIDEHTLNFVDMDTATITVSPHGSFGDSGDEAGPEPWTDANSNDTHDAGEDYTDLNGNAQWDETRDDPGQASEVVEYLVEYDYAPMTGFMSEVLGGEDGTVHLKASIVLRNEPWVSVSGDETS
jgi:Flp pilus assembly protein TadG